MEDSVIATSSTLQESLFPTNPTKKASAEVIILEPANTIVSRTLWDVVLKDLYIPPNNLNRALAFSHPGNWVLKRVLTQRNV